MSGKYDHLPLDQREAARWQDMGDYLSGKITRQELAQRERGQSMITDEQDTKQEHYWNWVVVPLVGSDADSGLFPGDIKVPCVVCGQECRVSPLVQALGGVALICVDCYFKRMPASNTIPQQLLGLPNGPMNELKKRLNELHDEQQEHE